MLKEWPTESLSKGTPNVGWWSSLPDFIQKPNPNIYKEGNYVVFDFETTTLEKGNPCNYDNRLVLAGWVVVQRVVQFTGESDELRGAYYKFGGVHDQDLLLSHIGEADFLVAHNAKFELGWLKRCGVDIGAKPVWCTQVAEYCIAGNRRVGLSFEACARRRKFSTKAKVVSALWKIGVDTRDIPDSILVPYLKNDVYTTWRIFKHQLSYILYDKPELLNTVWTRCLYTPVLADVQFNGMRLDEDRVNRLYRKELRRYTQLERKFQSKYGEYNWKSADDKDELIYKKLKFDLPKQFGNPMVTKKKDPNIEGRFRGQTNEKALGFIKATNKEQREFLKLFKELQKMNSRLTKYLNKFLYICETYNGEIRAQFNQTVTYTHRTSSTGVKEDAKVQFQNFDRTLKALLRAEFDEIGEVDASQLEWVTAVQLSEDVHGLNTIIDGEDRHAYTAEKIFGSKYTTATGNSKKELRTDAKSRTFKPLYGGESGTTKEKEYFKAFREEFKQLDRCQKGWANEVARNKQLTLPTGLTLYWPDAKKSFKTGELNHKRNVYNYPIQSVATADVVPIASVYLWHAMRGTGMKSQLINFVHDSAVAGLAPGEGPGWSEMAKYCFTEVVYWYMDVVYGYNWVVPLNSEVEIGTHWTDDGSWEKTWL